MPLLSIPEVNAFSQEEFVARLGFIFENSPWVMADTWLVRPFISFLELHAAACTVVNRSPMDKKLALIREHPQLAGKEAVLGAKGQYSMAEQSEAGLDKLDEAEIAQYDRYNAEYEERFDFPFVLCLRDHKRENILKIFATRLATPREKEIQNALVEVGQIAFHRLAEVVDTGPMRKVF